MEGRWSVPCEHVADAGVNRLSYVRTGLAADATRMHLGPTRTLFVLLLPSCSLPTYGEPRGSLRRD